MRELFSPRPKIFRWVFRSTGKVEKPQYVDESIRLTDSCVLIQWTRHWGLDSIRTSNELLCRISNGCESLRWIRKNMEYQNECKHCDETLRLGVFIQTNWNKMSDCVTDWIWNKATRTVSSGRLFSSFAFFCVLFHFWWMWNVFGGERKAFVARDILYLMQKERLWRKSVAAYHGLWSEKKPSDEIFSIVVYKFRSIIIIRRFLITCRQWPTAFGISWILARYAWSFTREEKNNNNNNNVICEICEWWCDGMLYGARESESSFLSQFYYACMCDYITHFYDWCWLCI